MAQSLAYFADITARPGVPTGVGVESFHDPGTGLLGVRATGPETEIPSGWNERVLWDRDLATGSVRTLIRCMAGKFEPPRWVPKCSQDFVVPEMQIAVTLTYTEDHLPQWRTMQRRVHAHLLGLKVKPQAKPNGTNPNNSSKPTPLRGAA